MTVWFNYCVISVLSVLYSAVIFVIQVATCEQYKDVATECLFHVAVLVV